MAQQVQEGFPMFKMLELFSGTGAVSQAFESRGWKATRVEIDARFSADFRDVRDFHASRGDFDFVWASPPSTEYARESMPWCKRGVTPDGTLLFETLRIMAEVEPKLWALENVRGAIKHFAPIMGKWQYHAGAAFIWGNLPRCDFPKVISRKEHLSSTHRVQRSAIPAPIAETVAGAVDDWFRCNLLRNLLRGCSVTPRLDRWGLTASVSWHGACKGNQYDRERMVVD